MQDTFFEKSNPKNKANQKKYSSSTEYFSKFNIFEDAREAKKYHTDFTVDLFGNLKSKYVYWTVSRKAKKSLKFFTEQELRDRLGEPFSLESLNLPVV
jgi:hypothetical protein